MNFKYQAALLSCLFFTSLNADILKDNIYVSEKNNYSIKSACSFIFKKNFPLVSKLSISKVDCMSQELDAIEFCKKKEVANPYLVRAIVGKDITCISSKKIDIRYLCKKNDPKCSTSEKACKSLGKTLANRLELKENYDVLNRNGQKEIVCYFRPKSIKILNGI